MRRLIPDETDPEYTAFLEDPQNYFLSALPSILQSTKYMAVVDTLSTHSPDEEYIGQRQQTDTWTGDATMVEAFYMFSTEIQRIEEEIERRNRDTSLKNRCGAGVLPYELLAPSSQPVMRVQSFEAPSAPESDAAFDFSSQVVSEVHPTAQSSSLSLRSSRPLPGRFDPNDRLARPLLSVISRRKVRMTSSHHAPYALGDTRATMGGTKGRDPARFPFFQTNKKEETKTTSSNLFKSHPCTYPNFDFYFHYFFNQRMFFL
ncbi:hypothetical protein L1987_47828 [Smallanthus sonchifolius]|uniref:Uncharacterized protein n=1 Tax=Smallanthus sonchifolius TaxID=185202 RepID=A0ACB9FPL4_9ASTR|nr:hypothetical protein L1987_47828 [Smallanthus sonchifolius]